MSEISNVRFARVNLSYDIQKFRVPYFGYWSYLMLPAANSRKILPLLLTMVMLAGCKYESHADKLLTVYSKCMSRASTAYKLPGSTQTYNRLDTGKAENCTDFYLRAATLLQGGKEQCPHFSQ